MRPMILDPLPTGVTSVTGVDFYPDSARAEEPVEAPVSLVGDEWTVDTLNVPPGRWWPMVHALKGAEPYDYPRVLVDLPFDDDLIVSPEAIASAIKVPLPLTDEHRETIRDAILDAQSDVAAYLGRSSLMPVTKTVTGLWAAGEEWEIDDDEGVLRVLSAVADVDVDSQPIGTFTITYLAGFNARDDAALRPIRRYVIAHVKNSPEVTGLWKDVVKPKGDIKSLSAEGQAVGFTTPTLGGGGAAGSGAPGALPTLGSLDYWRLAGRRVYQGATRFGERY
jgi:hypothetical protein